MTFQKEADFEEALIKVLADKGWENEVIKNPTEQDLIRNWAKIEQAKAELHKTFAALTQEEQKYANIFLHDIERGDVIAEDGKTLRDYITEYQFRAKDDQIHRFATIFGLDEDKLRNMMGFNLNEATINEFGRFDELKKSVDKSKAKAFFEAYEQTKLIPPKVNMKTDQLLRQFILTGGFEVDMP